MKKTQYIVFAIVSVFAVSCAKDNIADSGKSGLPTSFTVSMPSLDNGVETKTGLIEDEISHKDNKLVWTPGNTIYVTTVEELSGHGNNFDYAVYSTEGSGSTATFGYDTQTGTITAGTNYVAIYTNSESALHHTSSSTYCNGYVPNEQHYVAKSIEDGVMPMLAYGSLDALNFNCLGNIIRLNLKNTGANTIRVTRIDLNASSTSGDTKVCISGRFAIRTADPETTPRDQYGMYKSGAGLSYKYIYYYVDDPVTLGPSATAFNIVFSRYRGHYEDDFDDEMKIIATIYYTVNGLDVQTKVIPLNNLTIDRIKALGKIYTFKEKDTADWAS